MEECINKPICVFGIAANQNGLQIAEEMLNWLTPVYEVYQVLHDGTKYEYPALKKAQELSIEIKKPVLYLHTRGAFNIHKTTKPTHRMWKEQFSNNMQKYFEAVNTEIPTVACPFTGTKKITWYNGFVANWQAWSSVSIEETQDRMVFERLFCNTNVNVIGILANGNDHDQEDSVGIARKYLFNNYK